MAQMKLQNELDAIKKAFAAHIEQIKEYIPRLKESGKYKDFQKRLTWDCLYAFIGSEVMCGWYDKYGCNDDHIYTAGLAAMKQLGLLEG